MTSITAFDEIANLFADQSEFLTADLQARFNKLRPKSTATSPNICLEDLRTQGQVLGAMNKSLDNLAGQLVMNNATKVIRVYWEDEPTVDFMGHQGRFCAEYV
jgi:hypothetical protein